MRKMLKIEGLRSGRLTVVGRVPGSPSRVYVHCDCGTDKVVNLNNVVNGSLKSCGCWKNDRFRLIHRVIDTRPEFCSDRDFFEKNPVFINDSTEPTVVPAGHPGCWRTFIQAGSRKLLIGTFNSREKAEEEYRKTMAAILAGATEPKAAEEAD